MKFRYYLYFDAPHDSMRDNHKSPNLFRMDISHKNKGTHICPMHFHYHKLHEIISRPSTQFYELSYLRTTPIGCLVCAPMVEDLTRTIRHLHDPINRAEARELYLVGALSVHPQLDQ